MWVGVARVGGSLGDVDETLVTFVNEVRQPVGHDGNHLTFEEKNFEICTEK